MIEAGEDELNIAEVNMLADSAKDELKAKTTVIIKSCNHMISTIDNISYAKDKNIYEGSLEFPCPLCSKASNCLIPVISKQLKTAIMSTTTDIKQEGDPIDLIKFLNDLKDQSMSRLDLVKTHCLALSYSDEAADTINSEYSLIKDIENLLSRTRTKLRDLQTKMVGEEMPPVTSRDMLHPMLNLVETNGYASMVKTYAKTMHGLYVITRAVDLTRYCKLTRMLDSDDFQKRFDSTHYFSQHHAHPIASMLFRIMNDDLILIEASLLSIYCKLISVLVAY
jgi:hypothetical protein